MRFHVDTKLITDCPDHDWIRPFTEEENVDFWQIITVSYPSQEELRQILTEGDYLTGNKVSK